MSSRRQFIQSLSVSGVSMLAASALGAAAPAAAAPAAPAAGTGYTGPHRMVRGHKLLSIKQSDGAETLGIVTEQGVIDVRAVARAMQIEAPLTLDQLLQEGNAVGLNAIADVADSSGVARLDESTITHGRLFATPGKIICVGLNYRAHADEIKMAHPRVPPLFSKYNNSLAEHNCVLKLPPQDIAIKHDYETELLIVIGMPMRNVDAADALDYVAGYCTAHDFSTRDLQLERPGGQWMIGKTLDQYAPIGPYFVSADLVDDPNDLRIKTWVNGELRQDSSTADFIHNTQEMLAYISKFWTLEPGDIVFTGTPQGVIAGMPKERQVWLKPGDVVVSSVESLGELKFTLG